MNAGLPSIYFRLYLKLWNRWPLQRVDREGGNMFGRITAFLYGVICYLVFLATFVYAIGFIGNFLVPRSIDSGPESSLPRALAINAGLLGLFALQHSIMARAWFKAAWTKIVPKPVERSTYVLFSSVALLLLFWKWQPMGVVIWGVDSTTGQLALQSLYAAGWMVVLAATFLINHFDLFGLRQVWLNLVGRGDEPVGFQTPGLYRLVRHPLYLGWLMVFWSTPTMTLAHLVFALATTAYIFIAIQFEERDLIRLHKEYAEYRQRVPMILPIASARRGSLTEVRAARVRQAS